MEECWVTGFCVSPDLDYRIGRWGSDVWGTGARGEDREVGFLDRDCRGRVREGRDGTGNGGKRQSRQNQVSWVFRLCTSVSFGYFLFVVLLWHDGVAFCITCHASCDLSECQIAGGLLLEGGIMI
jgi:hypothetical protein